MTAMPYIACAFDIVSPWSYYAFEMLCRYEKVWNVKLEFQPVFLGGIMQLSGNKPPITVPAKGKWMWHDQEIHAELYGIERRDPFNFPWNTIKLQRLLYVIYEKRSQQDLIPIVRAFYQAYWSNGETMDSPDKFKEVLKRTQVLEDKTIDDYLSLSTTDDAKKKLTALTQAVHDKGAFGCPWIEVKKTEQDPSRFFFGSDRWDAIAWYLGVSYRGPFPEQKRPDGLTQSRL